MSRWFKVFVVMVCVLLPLTSSQAQDKKLKKILLLSAYHTSFVNGFEQLSGVKSVFSSDQYEIDVESMDT